MCSQSVSGSSLLSGYNEDDARETSGRSRREFEEIDAVLYDEEKAKRSSIKKICEEWSSKPHFRIRGRLSHIEKQSTINLTQLYNQQDITNIETTTSSTIDLLANNSKFSSLNSTEYHALLDDAASGRSSIDSIEGSELTNNSDLDDDDDATNTILDDHFSGTAADSFDTDEDDDENNDFLLDLSTHNHSKHRHRHHLHSKHPQLLIKCMKDSIVNSLATELLQQFFSDQQLLLQQYAKLIYSRNAIKLRPKLRPYSLPPRSLSQNRFSLPTASSITATSALLQIAPFPIRSTPEPGMKLTGLLRVTPLRITNSGSGTNVPISPRKSQIPSSSLPPPPPPPLPPPPSTERTSTSLIMDKRNQQQISLIGISVANPPSSHQLTIATTPQSSQSQIRQTPSTYRYRSATTVNTNIQNIESNTRLPPINIERLTSNEQLTLNRSNTTTSVIVESMPQTTRAVSGTSTGSNLSSTVKVRTSTNLGKLQRASRPISISSINNNKDLNNSTSTSPARSITATTVNPSSSSLKTTPVTRTQQQQQQQKRPLVTTKAPPPPASGVIKISAPHIF
ncbi:unnamed protein product [Rotaria sordida]|uniref:Uncharacterized protein n=1 Tax=Rotaria sordida TaxID=392033 RepID=A0A814ZX55_9BILA|nr:unnamed protein product [Rotaria sordida]CAF3665306.1 unnamed protein product [Rotaria sordida]